MENTNEARLLRAIEAFEARGRNTAFALFTIYHLPYEFNGPHRAADNVDGVAIAQSLFALFGLTPALKELLVLSMESTPYMTPDAPLLDDERIEGVLKALAQSSSVLHRIESFVAEVDEKALRKHLESEGRQNDPQLHAEAAAIRYPLWPVVLDYQTLQILFQHVAAAVSAARLEWLSRRGFLADGEVLESARLEQALKHQIYRNPHVMHSHIVAPPAPAPIHDQAPGGLFFAHAAPLPQPYQETAVIELQHPKGFRGRYGHPNYPLWNKQQYVQLNPPDPAVNFERSFEEEEAERFRLSAEGKYPTVGLFGCWPPTFVAPNSIQDYQIRKMMGGGMKDENKDALRPTVESAVNTPASTRDSTPAADVGKDTVVAADGNNGSQRGPQSTSAAQDEKAPVDAASTEAGGPDEKHESDATISSLSKLTLEDKSEKPTDTTGDASGSKKGKEKVTETIINPKDVTSPPASGTPAPSATIPQYTSKCPAQNPFSFGPASSPTKLEAYILRPLCDDVHTVIEWSYKIEQLPLEHSEIQAHMQKLGPDYSIIDAIAQLRPEELRLIRIRVKNRHGHLVSVQHGYPADMFTKMGTFQVRTVIFVLKTSSPPENSPFDREGNPIRAGPFGKPDAGSSGFGGFGNNHTAQWSSFGGFDSSSAPQASGFGGFGSNPAPQSSAFGGFGSRPAFGVPAGGFGSGPFSTNNTTQGVFGTNSAATQGVFGTKSAFGGFSNNTPSGSGSSAPNVSTALPENPGTFDAPFQPYIERDNTSITPQQYYQTIGFQQPYQHYSLEELRAVDYTWGRRYGIEAGRSTGFGPLGTSNPNANAKTGFGSSSAKAGGLFGSGAFTSTPSTLGGGTLFKSSQPDDGPAGGYKAYLDKAREQQPSEGSFGQSKPETTQTAGGGLFGAPQSGTSLFGQPQRPGGLFGGATSSTGFGQGTQPSGSLFGRPSGVSLFGNVNQNTSGQGTGLFGNTSSAPSGSGGLFSNVNTQANNQPTGGLFGNTQSTSTSGLFGKSSTAASPGLFGKPPPGATLFTATAPYTTNSSGGGLFGGLNQTNNAPRPLFGGTPQTQQQNTSLFSGLGSSTVSSQPPASSNTSLFANVGTATATSSAGGLFGSVAPRTGTSLFGGKSNIITGPFSQPSTQPTVAQTGSVVATQPQTPKSSSVSSATKAPIPGTTSSPAPTTPPSAPDAQPNTATSTAATMTTRSAFLFPHLEKTPVPSNAAPTTQTPPTDLATAASTPAAEPKKCRTCATNLTFHSPGEREAMLCDACGENENTSCLLCSAMLLTDKCKGEEDAATATAAPGDRAEVEEGAEEENKDGEAKEAVAEDADVDSDGS